MNAAYAALDVTTLQTYLSDAITARHKIATGQHEVEIQNPDIGHVKYSHATLRQLDTYIAELNEAITGKQGGLKRKPIHLVA